MGDSTITSVLSEETEAAGSALVVFALDDALVFESAFAFGLPFVPGRAAAFVVFPETALEDVWRFPVSLDEAFFELFDPRLFFDVVSPAEDGATSAATVFFDEALFLEDVVSAGAVVSPVFALIFGAAERAAGSVSAAVFLRTMRKNLPQQSVQLEG